MAYRVIITAPGGPEMLRVEDYEPGTPGPGEALIRHGAVGLNFIDIHHRTGRYKLPGYPSPIGLEAAGTVEAIGPGVTEVAVGDRVAYSAAPIGAYSDRRIMPAHRLVPLPDDVSDELAAGILTKGLTAHYLLFSTYVVRPGQTILVHAAAGGVGLILSQWAAHRGATVIGTAGGPEKVALARAHGCTHVIDYRSEDFVTAVRDLTGGRGVPVVFDAVGQDTFEGSLRCLEPCGTLVSYGTASGPIPPFDLFRLNELGSLYVTSPAFVTHTRERAMLLDRSRDLFGAIARGIVRMSVSGRYPLREAAQAQVDLQARRTSGTNVLVP